MTISRDELRQAGGKELTRLLLEAPADLVEAALDNPELDDGLLVLVLRRVDLPAIFLRRVFEDRERIGAYLVKSALASNPHTPRVIAMGLVKFLFWRDLVKVLADYRLDPGLRRLAEVTLRDRLTEISLGERISLARQAPREVIKELLKDHDERVIGALLDNSRTTEDDLRRIVTGNRSAPALLTRVARHPRWSARPSLRLALVRNPRTPAATALPLLTGLQDRDLRALGELPGLAGSVRLAAARLLQEHREHPPAGDSRPPSP